ncbi:hypothetical protein GVN24_29900 [Rhizobium sp. CRIBSB]|nr:hypothetical protein [Rhizobium sp. CRIBSB]
MDVRRVSLGSEGVTVSRFIFGTAGLFNVKGGPNERLRLLEAAADAGLTHFDTAPLYGFGLAESDLGAAFSKRPDVSITTKVGLFAPGGEDQGNRTVWLRKAAGKLLPPLSKAIADLSLERARTSVEGSLRRLKRDRIEILMLHEPDAAMLDTEGWQRWLEDLKSAGKIGDFGLALDDVRLAPFIDAKSPLLDLVQTTDSLDRHEADVLIKAGRPLQITYGYVSAASARSPETSVADVLGAALRRNTDGAVIVSTRRADRLSQYAAILDAAS